MQHTETIRITPVTASFESTSPKEKLRAETFADLQTMHATEIAIKNLEAELTLVKERLMKGWFKKYDIFTADNGLKVASLQKREFKKFNTEAFKAENELLYETYKTLEMKFSFVQLAKYF